MRRSPAIALGTLFCGLLVLAACGQPTGSGAAPGMRGGPGRGGPPAATSTTGNSSSISSGPVSLSALPLGDGRVSSSPRLGYVDSCQTQFGAGAGGSQVEGPWIHGSTWDATTKLAVQGSVSWPQASYNVTVSASQRIVTTADLPVGATTGLFPISPSDPAYAYDRNPNSIRTQSAQIALPAQPQAAAAPSCLNMGPIGVLKDGVYLFNALDAQGRDAAAHEVLDHCDGHPQQMGEYHHHDIPDCMLKTATGQATLVGYAFDGFGIYVERDASGQLLTDADLDACHGRTSVVPWDGQSASIYHYDATLEYPYTLGCYMGTPIASRPA